MGQHKRSKRTTWISIDWFLKPNPSNFSFSRSLHYKKKCTFWGSSGGGRSRFYKCLCRRVLLQNALELVHVGALPSLPPFVLLHSYINIIIHIQYRTILYIYTYIIHTYTILASTCMYYIYVEYMYGIYISYTYSMHIVCIYIVYN